MLRTRPYGELDVIATLLTEGHGKITGIAKAAKHSRRRFGGTLQPFVNVRAVFRQRPHADLVFLVRCELLRPLAVFSQDVDRFAAGSYVVELTDRMTVGRDSGREVYHLLHEALVLLETDGSLLLTLGALATTANEAPPNLRIFVFDNHGYERVKHNISATSFKTDLAAIARGAGFETTSTARTLEEFTEQAQHAMAATKLSFVVAKVEPGIAAVPARPGDGLEDKYRFVRHVERLEGKTILAEYRAKLD